MSRNERNLWRACFWVSIAAIIFHTITANFAAACMSAVAALAHSQILELTK